MSIMQPRAIPPQLETQELDELTLNALNEAQRSFNLTIANICRVSLSMNELSINDGWRVQLNPNEPGFRMFVRMKTKAGEVIDLPAGAVALVADDSLPADNPE